VEEAGVTGVWWLLEVAGDVGEEANGRSGGMRIFGAGRPFDQLAELPLVWVVDWL
jgi:hypothetical protein